MIFINELKPMKIYRKKFFLPIDKADKKHGNAILLLTPNYLSSKGLMSNNMTINRRYYESYYMETDVNYYIKSNYNRLKNNTIRESYIRDELLAPDREDRDVSIRDTNKDFDISTEFESYHISDKKYDNEEDIREYDWSSTLKDSIDKTLSEKVKDKNYYVYINNSNIYLGKIHVHYYNSSNYDYEWIETSDKIDEYKKESISEESYVNHDSIGIIRVSGFESDVNDFKNNLEYDSIRKISMNYNGLLPEIRFCIIPYLHDKCNIAVSEDRKYVYADFINKKSFDELYLDISYKQFIKDTMEFIIREYVMNDNVYNETSGLARFDLNYLTKHLKYVAKKSKYSMNKINREIKNVTKPPEVSSGDDGTDNSTNDDSNNTDNDNEVSESLIKEYAMDMGDGYLLLEDDKYDVYLKNLLYKDRIKQATQMAPVYKSIKKDLPFIKYTFIRDLNRYKKRNIFIDLSYYNELFFRYNKWKLDRGVGLYAELLDRMIKNNTYSNYGYNNTTIFIPILDWDMNKETKMWLYKEGINPISMIYRLMEINPRRVKSIFGNKDIIFFGKDKYFRLNMSLIDDKEIHNLKLKFKRFILALRDNGTIDEDDIDDTPFNKETHDAIMNNIVDKLEDKGIKVSKQYNLLGNKDRNEESNEDILDKKKQDLVDRLHYRTKDSTNTDDALDSIDNDEDIKRLIMNIASEEEDNIQISKSRSMRMEKLSNKSLDINVNNSTVRDLLSNKGDKEIPTTDIPVSINKEDWKNKTYINFDKDYNMNKALIQIIKNLENVSYPIIMRDVKIEDASTSEDYIDLYTFQMEDYAGRRFTIKLDIPKFDNGQFLYLRGNRKTIQSQLFNMPIIKTDQDTCQLITNYRKIFVYRYGRIGKSTEASDRILRCLKKYKGNKIKLLAGNCSSIAGKYNLPMDYIDLGRHYHTIETPTHIIYFDQDKLRNEYKVDDSKGFPYGINKKEKIVLYYNMASADTISNTILEILCRDEPSIEPQLHKATIGNTVYNYTRCRIMESYIPTIILTGYTEGLTSVLNKAGIVYTFKDKIDTEVKNSLYKDYIRFKDGYLVFANTYEASLLLNGLKRVNTIDVSIGDIDKKTTFLNFLDDLGVARVKVDGLDNFIDSFVDPITKEVLEHYKLPTDYTSMILYANNLLSDNKYINHTDSSSRRIRRQELIAVKAYKCIMTSYGNYANQIRHSKTKPEFSIKRSAVIDLFLSDYTSSDASVINVLNDVETLNAVTYKGESGLNNDRSYSLDKRTFDESMLNVLGMSTGFAGNVGITRAGTIDMSVETDKGYIKPINNDIEKLSSSKSLAMTEALNPMGTNHDDPFRTAMTFVQSARHAVRTDKGDPLLVTNGSDEAIAYISSDVFAHKAKDDGKVSELNDKYMIVEYKNGNKEYIDLSTRVEKNSDAGFYVPLKLDPIDKLKVGSRIKKGSILAYDKKSFSSNLGENDNIAYNVGTLSKIAILATDEGFEDSTIVTEDLCEEMATDIIDVEKIDLNKNTNVYNMVKVGDHIEEGDELLIYQDAYDDEDSRNIAKRLADMEDDLTSLGRRRLISEITGTVVDIKIYRTVDLNELSPTLKKLVQKYEAPIKQLKNTLNSNGINTNRMRSTDKLPNSGKLKATDGIYIEIYIKFHDIMKTGDKIVFDRANKGVIKDIIKSEDSPYTDFRPNEKIKAFANISSFNNRMVQSVIIVGSINKLLIELDRSVKDILGIPYNDNI